MRDPFTYESERVPNTITSICILKACSRTRTLHRGKTQKVLKGLSVRVVASKHALIKENFWWAGMYKDVVDYVQLCENCQMYSNIGIVMGCNLLILYIYIINGL